VEVPRSFLFLLFSERSKFNNIIQMILRGCRFSLQSDITRNRQPAEAGEARTSGDQRRGGLNCGRGHVGDALITLCASFSLVNVAGTTRTDEATADLRRRRKILARARSTGKLRAHNIHSSGGSTSPCGTRRKIKVLPRRLQRLPPVPPADLLFALYK